VPLQTVFLDAGGVLLYPNWWRVSQTLGEEGVHVSPAALIDADPHARRQLDDLQVIGTTTDASRGWLFFDLVLEHAGIARSDATGAALERLHRYHTASNLWEYVPADVPPALDALRARGLTLVVVSNANGTLRAHMNRIGLADKFDHILDSADEGVEKPDPRFFDIALERSGAAKSTTIHVGDLYYVDVMGARSAGLRGVLLDEANLRPDADCPRIRTLDDLVAQISAGTFD
jgi:HAD superfamily hydrolase (TIGR01509 family)